MNCELAQRAKYEAKRHKGIYGLSKAIGVNPGVIYRVMNGGNSPTLRRIWKIPKHPPRHRLIISCAPEAIARFDNQRGELTRAEWLERVLDMVDGVGEMEV